MARPADSYRAVKRNELRANGLFETWRNRPIRSRRFVWAEGALAVFMAKLFGKDPLAAMRINHGKYFPRGNY